MEKTAGEHVQKLQRELSNLQVKRFGNNIDNCLHCSEAKEVSSETTVIHS